MLNLAIKQLAMFALKYDFWWCTRSFIGVHGRL